MNGLNSLIPEGLCGRRYEKEYVSKYRDLLTVYIDGNVIFSRYCYGEAACLVMEIRGRDMGEEGLVWEAIPSWAAKDPPLPCRLTKKEGSTLWFDGSRLKWEFLEDLKTDKQHGYSRMRLFLKRLLQKI